MYGLVTINKRNNSTINIFIYLLFYDILTGQPFNYSSKCYDICRY